MHELVRYINVGKIIKHAKNQMVNKHQSHKKTTNKWYTA